MGKACLMVVVVMLLLAGPTVAFSRSRVVVDSNTAFSGKDSSVVTSDASGGLPSAAASSAPAALPPNQPQLLRGSFCHWSGSSSSFGSSSTTRWARFDGQRRFTYGRNFMYSGSSGSYSNQDPVKGGIYEVRGDWVLMRYDEGGDDSAQIAGRAPDGSITSLKYDGQLFSPSLCQ